ncbi:MAG: xylulokinase [Actinomycetota bacterium]|jgi:xylulokinase|nr:xylulokinase [Actinomycetota bacterium]
MIVAHDIGTTGDKASLHDARGRLVAATTAHYDTRYEANGVVEQDPGDWWNAFCQATRTLLEQTGVRPMDVEVVGVSGQMMGAVFLDSAGVPVRPAIIWADTRSQEQCATLIERIGQEAAYQQLGHRLNPTYSITKVMWVRDHEPEVFDRTTTVCNAKDFVAYQLTGVLVTDPSDASSTNAFDQQAGTWSAEVLDAAGISPALMPTIVPSTTVIGRVTRRAADATGLVEGTPVVIGGGDGPIAAAGVGIVEPADGAYAYLGSSSWISLASDEPLHDLPLMRTMTFNHVHADRFVPTATMQAGGGSLHWVADLLAGRDDGERFTRLVADADTTDASGEGLYFLPYLLGERSPLWNPKARGAFVGLGRHHGPAHLTKAVLEGVAFNLGICVDAFRDRGVVIDRVDAIGGGAASDVWLQVLADAWDCTVRRRTIVDEANSLGAAVTAGVGVGLFADFTPARSLSEVTNEFTPVPSRVADYRRHREAFVDAYECLEPWFERNV